MTDSLCYLNGAYKPLSQAQVNVLDRGFLFGLTAIRKSCFWRSARLVSHDETTERGQRLARRARPSCLRVVV